MKKTIALLAALLTGLSYAEEGYTYEPTDYITSQATQVYKVATEKMPFEMGFNVGYGMSTNADTENFTEDMYFANLDMAYYFMETVALTFDFGLGFSNQEIATGGCGYYDDYDWYYDEYYGYYCEGVKYDFDRWSLNFMVGLRSIMEVMPRTTLVLGAKAGVDAQCLTVSADTSSACYDCSYNYNYDSGYYEDVNSESSHNAWAFGFTYAFYAGLNFQITNKTALEVGYQYRASTAAPTAKGQWFGMDGDIMAGKLSFHEIRAGLRWKF